MRDRQPAPGVAGAMRAAGDGAPTGQAFGSNR
jgi:hypothetical protein